MPIGPSSFAGSTSDWEMSNRMSPICAKQTKENQFAFVGLQMVDITRTHVTPARDRVFAAIQQPNASDADASVSLQHVVRARELLGALLKRYDRVVQEQKLQQSLDETVTMYEVYVQKRRMLMREARQNLNPLERKMAVVEVDQEYLDRLAEVLKQRREMMDEFAQMLADDPRLLSRYLELVKRRGKSLRDRLSEISQLQYDATEEMLGWLQIDETQKQDLWTIIVELRLHSATDLAKDAAELAERIEKQMPLEVDAEVGTPAEVIREAKQIAGLARTISFDAEGVMADAGHVKDGAASACPRARPWSPDSTASRQLLIVCNSKTRESTRSRTTSNRECWKHAPWRIKPTPGPA